MLSPDISPETRCPPPGDLDDNSTVPPRGNHLQHSSEGLDSDFINELDAFRQNANAEAHSIETNITKDEMKEYREQARHAVQILFRVNQNM